MNIRVGSFALTSNPQYMVVVTVIENNDYKNRGVER